MKIPYFDELTLPGTLWSSSVSVLQPIDGLPQPVYVGERCVTDPNYRLSGRGRGGKWSTLKICTAGSGFIEVEGKRQVIQAGEALLFSTANEKCIHGIAEGADCFQFIRFSFLGMNTVIEQMNQRFGYVLPIPRNHSIVKRMLNYKRGKNVCLSMQASVAAEWVWSIIGACLHICEATQPDNSLSSRCIDWINGNIETGATIAECADALSVSQEHLTRVFSECLQQTPGAFLLRERLRHGLALLLSSDDAIKSIAKRCGYVHPAHFSRAMKEQFGASPRELRQHPSAWQTMT